MIYKELYDIIKPNLMTITRGENGATFIVVELVKSIVSSGKEFGTNLENLKDGKEKKRDAK